MLLLISCNAIKGRALWFEPMYAMRYGTIPIVRRTGGLQDTVIDYGDNGNGICHDQASVGDICYSIKRAVGIYNDKEHLNKLFKA
jgi:starch synthase